MEQTLATKYRPTTFDDVVEQGSIKTILQHQLKTKTTKNAYLFIGGAGTGKTTCARIFANEINNHEGLPIELDAASNSGVDDVREIIQQAKTQSLDSEYKVFIIDECHSLSNTAWQAFLKLIEEPPAKSIFIFCTTNPEKIPKTILSRVQRYDFRRISEKGIYERLHYILTQEHQLDSTIGWEASSLVFIAKLADGGMRDAITMMDKCLSYSNDLIIENVVSALGVADYEMMMKLTMHIVLGKADTVIEMIEKIHADGIDLKHFVRQWIDFVLDVQKYAILRNFDYIKIPQTDEYETFLEDMYKDVQAGRTEISDLLSKLIAINAEIKYDSSPKYMIEAMLLEVLNDRAE